MVSKRPHPFCVCNDRILARLLQMQTVASGRNQKLRDQPLIPPLGLLQQRDLRARALAAVLPRPVGETGP